MTDSTLSVSFSYILRGVFSGGAEFVGGSADCHLTLFAWDPSGCSLLGLQDDELLNLTTEHLSISWSIFVYKLYHFSLIPFTQCPPTCKILPIGELPVISAVCPPLPLTLGVQNYVAHADQSARTKEAQMWRELSILWKMLYSRRAVQVLGAYAYGKT